MFHWRVWLVMSCYVITSYRDNVLTINHLRAVGLSTLQPFRLPVKPRLHQDTCCRTHVVSTCCRQHVSCIGNKIVASLSPVCCWIQRDTSRPWHKWIVIMSQRYSNMYPERATCIRQHVSVNICVSGYKLLVRDVLKLYWSLTCTSDFKSEVNPGIIRCLFISVAVAF